MGIAKRTKLLIARDSAYREYAWAQNEADEAHRIFSLEKDLKKQVILKRQWDCARTRAAYLRGSWHQIIEAIQSLD